MGNTKSKDTGTAIAAVGLDVAAHRAKNTLAHNYDNNNSGIDSSTQTATPSPGKSSPSPFYNQQNSPNSIHSNSPSDNTNRISHDILSGNTPGTTVLIVQPENGIMSNHHPYLGGGGGVSSSSSSSSSNVLSQSSSPRGPLSVTSTNTTSPSSLVSSARQAQMMEALIHEGAYLNNNNVPPPVSNVGGHGGGYPVQQQVSPTKIPNYTSSVPSPVYSNGKFLTHSPGNNNPNSNNNNNNKVPLRNHPLTPSTVRSNGASGSHSVDTTPSYQNPTISHMLRQRSISPTGSTLTYRTTQNNTHPGSISPNQKEDKERDAHTLPTWMTYPPGERLTSTGLQSYPNHLALKEKEQREQYAANAAATAAALQSIESLKADLKAKDKILQEATTKAVKLSIALDTHNESKSNLLVAYEQSKKEMENLKHQLSTMNDSMKIKLDEQKNHHDTLQTKVNDLTNALQLRDKEILEQRKLQRQYINTIQQLQAQEQKIRTEYTNQELIMQDMHIALESAHQARDTILNEYNEYRSNSAIAQTARTAAEETAAQLRVQVLTMKEKMNRLNQAKLLAERKAEALARYVKSHTEIITEDMNTSHSSTGATMVTPTKGSTKGNGMISSTGSTGRPTLLHSPVRSTTLLSPSPNLSTPSSSLSPHGLSTRNEGTNGLLHHDNTRTSSNASLMDDTNGDFLMTDPDANLDDYAAIANNNNNENGTLQTNGHYYNGSIDDTVVQLKSLLGHRQKRIDVLTTKLADAEGDTIGLRSQVAELTSALQTTKEKALYYEKRAAYQSDLLKRLRAQGVTMASEGLDTLATSRFASKSPLGRQVVVSPTGQKSKNETDSVGNVSQANNQTNNPVLIPAANEAPIVRTVSSPTVSPVLTTIDPVSGQVPIRSPMERVQQQQRQPAGTSPRGGHFTPRNSRPPTSSVESGNTVLTTPADDNSSSTENNTVGSRIPSRTHTPGGSGIAAVRAMQQIPIPDDLNFPTVSDSGTHEPLMMNNSIPVEEKNFLPSTTTTTAELPSIDESNNTAPIVTNDDTFMPKEEEGKLVDDASSPSEKTGEEGNNHHPNSGTVPSEAAAATVTDVSEFPMEAVNSSNSSASSAILDAVPESTATTENHQVNSVDVGVEATPVDIPTVVETITVQSTGEAVTVPEMETAVVLPSNGNEEGTAKAGEVEKGIIASDTAIAATTAEELPSETQS